MGWLWASPDRAHQDFCFRVFLAFDSGEFYPDERRDIEPAEMFTAPLIAELMPEAERILSAALT